MARSAKEKVQDYGIAQDDVRMLCECGASEMAKSANGRDAEGAKDAEVRWACVMACVLAWSIC